MTVDPDEKVIPKVLKVAGLPDIEMPPLKEEQIEIVKMKVDDVPVEKLFTPVPLVARLSGGV